MAKQMKKDADMNIPYQNKDSISKLFGERMKGKPLSLFGLKSDKKVVGICPTNIPVLDVKELRMDNLFELEDGSVAILDYESAYKEENFIKYGLYILNVKKRFMKEDKDKDIRMMVLYTADIEDAKTSIHMTCCDIRVEVAFLVGADSDTWRREIEDGINRQEVTDEVLMHLVLLPLTYKGEDEKQPVIEACVELACRIQDKEKETFALAGILAFTDKVISDETRNHIKEVLVMTKVGKMLVDEGKIEGRIEGRIEEKKETCLRMHKQGFDNEVIAKANDISVSQVEIWLEETRCVS